MLMKRFSLFFTASIAILILSSWGGTGHYIISLEAIRSFNSEMIQFLDWGNYLAGHASDADNRKSTDPSEAPKHYIDIDNYPGFQTNQQIPFTFTDAVNTYGYSFVIDNGILPWATKTTYDSLVLALKDLRVERAKQLAADLGHYVADGHMPLHLTKNYNGQLTGNTGIHSRYESTMINSHADEFYNSEPRQINYIQDIQQYIFDYIIFNYRYVDSTIKADDYAKSINPDYNSQQYKDALWQKTKGFTMQLFANASQRLAELIFSAWIDAGSPSVTITPTETVEKPIMYVYPNPSNGNFNVVFNNLNTHNCRLEIFNINGKVERIYSLNKTQQISDNIRLSEGMYIFKLTGNHSSITQTVLFR